MIAASLVEQIRGLLAEGELSQRKIARRVGVSRGTVAAIASGRRPDYEAMRRAVKEAVAPLDGPLGRCPGCGGLTHMPCRLCHARRVAAKRPRTPVPAWARELDEPLGLALRGEHRARYEAIRAEKVRAVAVEAAGEAARSEDWPSDEADWSDVFDVVDVESEEWAMGPGELGEALEWEDANDAGLAGLCRTEAVA